MVRTDLYEGVSANERAFVVAALAAEQRVDGRRPFDLRKPRFDFGPRDGVVEVTFTRAATVAEGDPYGANVSRGVATEVIWAAGEDGAGFEMDYHGQVRGHLEVTF